MTSSSEVKEVLLISMKLAVRTRIKALRRKGEPKLSMVLIRRNGTLLRSQLILWMPLKRLGKFNSFKTGNKCSVRTELDSCN